MRNSLEQNTNWHIRLAPINTFSKLELTHAVMETTQIQTKQQNLHYTRTFCSIRSMCCMKQNKIGIPPDKHENSLALSTYKGYIAKGSLSRAVCSSASHTWNTGDSSPCSPWLSTRLVSCFGGNSIRLPLVFPHIGVHKLDNVWANRSLEDCRKEGTSGCLSLTIKHSHEGSGSLWGDKYMYIFWRENIMFRL